MSGWRQELIDGKQCDIYEPQRRGEPVGVVLFLHGHGRITLRDNPVYSAELERCGLLAVCPHGQRSWWEDLVCREFDPQVTPVNYLRQSVVPWIAREWGVAPPAIGLVGVSMGGQGALRLSYRYPTEFPIVVALSPAIDFYHWHGRGLPLDELYESAETARQASATLHVNPLNWPRHQLLLCDPTDREWCEGVERLVSKLSSTGIPFEADLQTRHGGHSWDYFNHMAPRVVQFVRDKTMSTAAAAPPGDGILGKQVANS
ncbi:MAG: alpha/beta hydrolase-fold protein [Planctomycetales bacterium]